MLKKILIIIGIVLLSLVASYFFITLFIIPQVLNESNADSTATETAVPENQEEQPRSPVGSREYLRNFAIYNLEDIIINPKGTESRFLVAQFAFEYRISDRRLPDELNSKKPLIIDQINNYLGSRYLEELSDINFRDRIRDDIRILINNMLVEGQITRVLIIQFIIQ